MQRILITGVGGNVGQYIANDLALKGYDVIGIYRNSMPQNANYELIRADISKMSCGGKSDVDIVIHIAASILGDTNTLIQDNIEATKNLVCWAEANRVKRFMYMSTVAVYGRVDGELCEKSDRNNPSVYGITKHLCESIVMEAKIPEKIIIQLPKMIGPYVNLKDTKDSGFLTMAKKILNDEKVICFIPDMKYNNYLHVTELGKFLYHLLKKDKWNENETILVGANERLTMLQILQIMKNAIKSKSEITLQRDNDKIPVVSLINIDRAKALGFAPCTAEIMLQCFMKEISSIWSLRDNTYMKRTELKEEDEK